MVYLSAMRISFFRKRLFGKSSLKYFCTVWSEFMAFLFWNLC